MKPLHVAAVLTVVAVGAALLAVRLGLVHLSIWKRAEISLANVALVGMPNGCLGVATDVGATPTTVPCGSASWWKVKVVSVDRNDRPVIVLIPMVSTRTFGDGNTLGVIEEGGVTKFTVNGPSGRHDESRFQWRVENYAVRSGHPKPDHKMGVGSVYCLRNVYTQQLLVVDPSDGALALSAGPYTEVGALWATAGLRDVRRW
jgi:hypothetical protein